MELQQKTLDDLVQKEAEDVERVAEKLREMGLDSGEYNIAVLPAFNRHFEKTSERRKGALADRLAEIAAEMSAGPIEETTQSYEVGSAPTDMALIPQACATCRGYCCKNGGDKAYLTRQTLARVLAAAPEMSLEDVLRAYLDRVPEQSYAGSCIYHAEKGCTLPGEMRSDTCNDFYCTNVRGLSSIVRDEESRPVLAAALKGEKVVRLAVIDGNEMKYLFGE